MWEQNGNEFRSTNWEVANVWFHGFMELWSFFNQLESLELVKWTVSTEQHVTRLDSWISSDIEQSEVMG